MRFLIWCACITVCLEGLELSLFAHDGWRWVWIALLIFYGFAGVVGLCLQLAKLVTGKLGAGIGKRGDGVSGPILAPRKQEVEK